MRNAIRMTCELMALTAHLSQSTRDFETRIKTTSKRVVCADPRGDSTCWPLWGTECLTSHHYYRQPLKAAVFFCLLSLATRKRVHVLLEGDLITGQVFLSLVLNVLLNHFCILSYCIHKVPSAPEVSAPILILQICMPIKNHQRTFTLERLYKLCYIHVWRDTH